MRRPHKLPSDCAGAGALSRGLGSQWTKRQTFTLFDPLAQQQIAESAAELLDGLWAAYTGATQAFLTNPTEKRWRDRVRAHAAYAVAHRDETGTVEGVSDADG